MAHHRAFRAACSLQLSTDIWGCARIGRPMSRTRSASGVRRSRRRSRTPSGGVLSAGNGILKVTALVGVGSGTVQRVKKEMVRKLVAA